MTGESERVNRCYPLKTKRTLEYRCYPLKAKREYRCYPPESEADVGVPVLVLDEWLVVDS